MRKSISIIILLALMMPTLIYGQDIQIVINGEQVSTWVAPIIQEGVTLIPLRLIATNLGVIARFDSENNKVIVTDNTKNIQLPIGKKIAIVDGKEYTLQIPTNIIRGTTMVPLKFVAEHLGFTTEWDGKSNTIRITSDTDMSTTDTDISTSNADITTTDTDTTVTDLDNQQLPTIQSEIQPPKEYMDEAIRILESKIAFTNDIEVFTLYAFMNYTGYTEENSEGGFSDVRKGVLEDLTSMNLHLKNNYYYRDKQVESGHYRQALIHMNKAPDFNYNSNSPNYHSKLADLPSHLKAFYKEANIEELYKKYQEAYTEEQEKYKELVCPAIAKINYYLKVDNQKVEPFLININLLEAYWRGYGLGGGVYYYNNMPMILAGPSYAPNVGVIAHEYLHGIISPIVRELDEVNNLDYLRSDVPLGSQADGYVQWRSILDESIIRGLENKGVDEDAKAIIQYEYNEGFILALYFYERFDEFEQYNGSLKAFIKKLIVEYK